MRNRSSVITVGGSRRIIWAVCIVGLMTLCGCVTGRSGGSGAFFGREGAPWAILCSELPGPNRMQHIEQFAETLKRTPGIRPDDVFVMDEPDGFAPLYYGTYYRRTDPKTGKRPIPKPMRRTWISSKGSVTLRGGPTFYARSR